MADLMRRIESPPTNGGAPSTMPAERPHSGGNAAPQQAPLSRRDLFFYFLDLNKPENIGLFDSVAFEQNAQAFVSGRYSWNPKELAVFMHRTASLMASLSDEQKRNAVSDSLDKHLPQWETLALPKCPQTEQQIRQALTAANDTVRQCFNPQGIANIWWAFVKAGIKPGAKFTAALDMAVACAASSMNAQDAANTAWAYASSGHKPDKHVQQALDEAVYVYRVA